MKLVHVSLAALLLSAAGCGASDGGSAALGTNNGNASANGGDNGSASNGGAGGSGAGSGSSAGGDDTDDGICKEYVVRADRATPDILIVLDRSGSMNPGSGSNTDRWTGSREAIVQVTGQFEDQIRFGLMTFPAAPMAPDCTGKTGLDLITCQFSGAFGDQCGAGTVNVDIDLNTGDEIAAALSAMQAQGGTPTSLTLETALGVIGSGFAGPDAKVTPKVIVLVTDGEPNCLPNGGTDSQALTATISAIQALTDNGVKTYVVGFETSSDANLSSNLDMMAAVGNTGETTHRSVNSGADLEATFAELAGKAVSCSFALEEAPKDASYVLVQVDDQQLNLDDPNGWTLSEDGKTITVQGSACDTLQDGGEHKLDVQVLCVVVPIV
jgi:hypothetical protein